MSEIYGVLDTGDDHPEVPWAQLGYLQWHDRAATYWKAGKRQSFCTVCSRWRWDDEPCCDAPRMPAAEARRTLRNAERRIKAHEARQEREYVKAYRSSIPDVEEDA